MSGYSEFLKGASPCLLSGRAVHCERRKKDISAVNESAEALNPELIKALKAMFSKSTVQTYDEAVALVNIMLYELGGQASRFLVDSEMVFK